MFIQPAHKIKFDHVLQSVAWHRGRGWIACGGNGGLLKVVQLDDDQPLQSNAVTVSASCDASDDGDDTTAPAPPLPQSADARLIEDAQPKHSLTPLHRALIGHKDNVTITRWNHQHRKLTSCDSSGLTIVWSKHDDDVWREEMLNMSKSPVRDIAWSLDGRKLCLVLEDGNVVMGDVGGDRIWGKDLKKPLTHVAWSPDGRNVLFGVADGELHVHDAVSGKPIRKAGTKFCNSPNPHHENKSQKPAVGFFASVQWHKAAGVAVACKHGEIQLMHNEEDASPTVLDTGLNIVTACWNSAGTTLVVAGAPLDRPADLDPVVDVKFYSSSGVHQCTLRIEGSQCGGVACEGDGVRVAVAVDSCLYVADAPSCDSSR